MARRVIEIRDLTYTYPDGNQALKDIELDVFEGESLGIIGPNGAGKTTLLLHINGLLDGIGRIKLFDLELNKKNLREIRRRIGLVFQDPEDQLFMPTIYEDVSFGLTNRGLEESQIRTLTITALKRVGMEDKLGHLSYHLSLGEKKRLSLATVLVMEPEVLILDEPSSNLDPKARRHLIDLLKNLRVTKIIAGHDLELILNLCNRVVVLDKGRIVATGKAEEVLSNPSLMELHSLEVPLSLRKQ